MDIKDLRKSVRQSLLMVWDPIGIREFPEASDEYDSYVDEIVDLLIHGASTVDVYNRLWLIETDHMCLPGDSEKTYKYAEYLTNLLENPEKGQE